MSEPILEVGSLSFAYPKGSEILRDLSFRLSRGERLFVVGPNGGGKSTLLRLLAGLLVKRSGQILLDGREIREWSSPALARFLAFVPQFRSPTFPFTVLETVVMGRAPYLSRFRIPGEECYRLAEESLSRVGILHLRNRLCTELSGGEWQLVNIARALTQNPSVLLLDEPTAHLDMAYKERILELIAGMTKAGITLIVVSHSPDIPLRYRSLSLLLNRERVLGFGESESVLSETNLSLIFSTPVRRVKTLGPAPREFCVPEGKPSQDRS